MIQNQKILTKLDEKTRGDKILQTFIANILENESEGRHFTKYYNSQIKHAVEEKQKLGDKQR